MNETAPPTFRCDIRGFDFESVWVRAKTLPRARIICAEAFAGAGFGSVGDGLKAIAKTVRDPDRDSLRLVVSQLGPEGLCVSPKGGAT